MGKKKGGAGEGKKDDGGAGSAKRDAELNAAIAHSELMTVRLEATEKSRNDYRENCKKVSSENEKLHENLYQAERDTIEVITYLKKQDMVKDETIAHINQIMLDLKQENKAEKQQIVKDFSEKIAALEKSLESKGNEVKLIQGELKMVQEFRRKRQQMQNELDNIRESLFETNREHKSSLQKMEQKFFEEKLRLEQEANQKLSELAERAHTEAIAKLDETTRDVYKENVRLTDALACHTKETAELQKKYDQLKLEADQLRAEKQLNGATVRMKITENKRMRSENHALREKVDELETGINNMVHEVQKERKNMNEKMELEVWSSNDELHRLRKILKIKEVESNRVKILARNIIEQRSDLEIFFHQALQQVRTQIQLNRAQYISAAKEAYQRKMIAATTTSGNGEGEIPKVRTFNRNEQSSNSVMADLRQAENTCNLEGRKDIRELTWEQKEKVLRLLFAKMNNRQQQQQSTTTNKKKHDKPQKKTTSERIATRITKALEDVESASTFITQQESTSNNNISNSNISNSNISNSNMVLPAIGFNS